MALPIVRSIVTAKIANSRIVLLRVARESSIPDDQEALRTVADKLAWEEQNP